MRPDQARRNVTRVSYAVNGAGGPPALEIGFDGFQVGQQQQGGQTLGRAVGVPTRVAVGLVYREGRFGYHAWNEVLTGDGWLSVDPTWDQMPADVGHLRVVSGGLDRQVELLQVMGRLTLEAVGHR